MHVWIALILALLATPRIVGAQPSACYQYDRDTVTLSGHVARRVYPGRPNYESVKTGDEPDTVYVLQLPKPLCTERSTEFEARAEIREVQLYFTREDAAAVRALRGRPATFRGTLTGAVWGWHHLPVLFQVRLRRPRSVTRAV